MSATTSKTFRTFTTGSGTGAVQYGPNGTNVYDAAQFAGMSFAEGDRIVPGTTDECAFGRVTIALRARGEFRKVA